jgi:hypothetical protein
MMTIDELIQSGVDQARTVLIGQKDAELTPAFVIQFKDGRPTAIVATPWGNDREKHTATTAMWMMFKVYGRAVDSYLFWSEAWRARESIKHPIGLMPRDREDKQEVVILSAYNHDGGKMRILEIKRGPDGVVTELVAEDDVYDHLSGRLHNLLADE